MKNGIRQLGNIVIPAAIFYVIYISSGIVMAIIASSLFSLSNAIYSFTKEKRISNTQLFGLIGLLLSLIGILFTANEKLYYVPALVSNCIFLCFAIALTVQRKSILHFIIQDFKIQNLEKISENKLFRLNIIWIIFFVLKILSKSLGILFLSFHDLYWLVFILGDPMTIIVVGYSVYYVNRAVRKEQTEKRRS
jgi:intracellular septation protein A